MPDKSILYIYLKNCIRSLIRSTVSMSSLLTSLTGARSHQKHTLQPPLPVNTMSPHSLLFIYVRLRPITFDGTFVVHDTLLRLTTTEHHCPTSPFWRNHSTVTWSHFAPRFSNQEPTVHHPPPPYLWFPLSPTGPEAPYTRTTQGRRRLSSHTDLTCILTTPSVRPGLPRPSRSPTSVRYRTSYLKEDSYYLSETLKNRSFNCIIFPRFLFYRRGYTVRGIPEWNVQETFTYEGPYRGERRHYLWNTKQFSLQKRTGRRSPYIHRGYGSIGLVWSNQLDILINTQEDSSWIYGLQLKSNFKGPVPII